jgi:hypothetical protein
MKRFWVKVKRIKKGLPIFNKASGESSKILSEFVNIFEAKISEIAVRGTIASPLSQFDVDNAEDKAKVLVSQRLSEIKQTIENQTHEISDLLEQLSAPLDIDRKIEKEPVIDKLVAFWKKCKSLRN